MKGNITRRALLAFCGACALACGPEGNDEMAIAPWHMWGGLATYNAFNGAFVSDVNFRAQGQLARIEYHRPESWRFMFFTRISRALVANPCILSVDFDIVPGVGRGSLSVPSFETFRFTLPAGETVGVTKWSGSVNGPVRDDTAVVPPVLQNEVDSIEAQDLQVSYRVLYTPGAGPAVGDEIIAEIGVVLAPWHHARPDWFAGKFPAEELGGK